MIRANKGERASMWCFTSDVGSGSSSHDFVADASAIFFTSESDAGSNTSKRVLTTLGMSSAGSGGYSDQVQRQRQCQCNGSAMAVQCQCNGSAMVGHVHDFVYRAQTSVVCVTIIVLTPFLA